ncbi:MAG: hypothetical protein AAF719_02690 [Pseudomonadota bacterium]
MKDQISNTERTKLWVTNAVGFITAARLLLELREAGEMFHWPAFYTNLGFAFEYSLKGYLAFKGWSDEKLRLEIGHNIEKAMSEAIQIGFKPHAPLVQDIVEVLGPLHKTNQTRYLNGAPIVTPVDHEQACSCVWDHVQAVGSQLGVESWS